MFKRLVPASLIAISIMLVAAGSAALAIGITDRSRGEDLIDRVAADLGLESEEVEQALSQAQREQFKERQDEVLARLVEAETITQEQADLATEWLDSRPDSADRLLSGGGLTSLILTHSGPYFFDEARAFGGSSLGDDDLLDRLAEILNIDSDDLKDSVTKAEQAQAKDRRLDAMNEIVDSLVEQGELTASEGDEIKVWLAEMPEWIAEFDGISLLVNGGIPSLVAPQMFPFDFDSDLPGFEFPIPELRERNGEGREHFRFFFGDSAEEFEFNGGSESLPEDLQRFLDELHESFEFESGDLEGFPWAPFEMPDEDVMTEESDRDGQNA